MFAPLDKARFRSSRITIPAPSARTIPFRFLLKGRQAFDGSLLSVANNPTEAKDITTIGVIGASDAPAIAISYWPPRIRWNASPIADVPEAHAATTVEIDPWMPHIIPIWEASELGNTQLLK